MMEYNLAAIFAFLLLIIFPEVKLCDALGSILQNRKN